MILKLGYNTSGFSRTEILADVIKTIHDLGYAGLELTLDKKHFHPYFSEKLALHQLAWQIGTYNLDIILNTGGRYVLSDVAHEPSLVSASVAQRKRFVHFVFDTIQIAPVLGANIIMLHSGSLPIGIDLSTAWDWLVNQVIFLAKVALDQDVILGFEFHPSMFISNLTDFKRLSSQVDSPALRLTLDVGHVVCTENRPISQVIKDCNDEIVNVHLEDIKGRNHFHLPIGQGDIDFLDVFQGLKAIQYKGLINAEFNTNDLEVDECQVAQETFQYLRQLI